MSGAECSVGGCERRVRARRLCSMHYKRWLKHGDPTQVLTGGNKGHLTGELNPFWRGDHVTYSGAHMRVRAVRGPAAAQTCPCGVAAAHWAYDNADPDERIHRDGRRYSADPDHYRAMCVSCHKLFDLAVKAS